MRKSVFVVAVVVSVASSPPRAIAGTGVADCVVVAPSADDTTAIRTAITTALSTGGKHAVCLTAGTFNIDQSKRTSNVSFNLGNPAGTGPASNLAIIGVGPATVLKLTGNAGATSWTVFQVNNGASRIVVRDLAIDGASVTNPGTSTQFFQLGTADTAGAQQIKLDHLVLRNSPEDAINVLGSTSVVNVSAIQIHNVHVVSSQRYGISVLSGTQDIQITSCFFDSNVSQDIRTFYSGTLTIPFAVSNLIVSGNIITRATAFQPLAIDIYGNDVADDQNVVVAANIVSSGRVHIKNTDQVVFASNIVIGGTQTSTTPDVALERKGDYSEIVGNTIIHTSTTGTAVLNLTHVSGSAPRRASIHGNVIEQSTTLAAVTIASITNVSFTGNYIGNSAPSGSYGVQFVAQNNSMDEVVIADNIVNGNETGSASLIAGFQLSPVTGTEIGRVVIDSNIVHGATYGVGFANVTNGYGTIPLIADNEFDGADFNGFPSTSLPVIAVGGNLATTSAGALLGPVVLTGNGAPTTAAPVGSLFLRRDSVAGSMLYVRESTTSWTGK